MINFGVFECNRYDDVKSLRKHKKHPEQFFYKDVGSFLDNYTKKECNYLKNHLDSINSVCTKKWYWSTGMEVKSNDTRILLWFRILNIDDRILSKLFVRDLES